MPQAIFCLPYFGPISVYKSLINYNSIYIEAAENYQKQSYRNRQYIYGANGKLMLNIPVKHSGSKQRLKYSESQIENDFEWQDLHLKSLESAYRTSPYFEFYEDDIQPLYDKNFESLFEFNLKCFESILNLLDIEVNIEMTSEYFKNYSKISDERKLIDAKSKKDFKLKTYHQVFEDKFGFISNLSILDLLFNLGPESVNYLKGS
ncbi:WbqC family protein [Mesohalobacter halotolerans]|uniref:WbqC family protein n=1 Tax=Mesohalobacter halotolerans TaxID=1883405 RepID=A0A4U5TQA5_9FLAO|nr:WbqC family protein [Mesohalobacter halotolerans]TKS56367.1 WbqC family protein [Mesohalobacter halotolerans]